MKEATWGVFIILIGAIGIIAFNLFRDLTSTTDQTYFLMKEATRAAMGDAIDVSLQRTNTRIVMDEDKFVENLTRRFAQSVSINRDYYIVIHKIVEDPPMVSLSVVTNAEDLAGEKYDILLEVDAIFEVRHKLYTPELPHYIEKPDILDDDGEVLCPDCEDYDFCIDGDLAFSKWKYDGNNLPPGFPKSYKNFNELKNITNTAYYEECVEGKWEEKEEEVNSVISNENTYANYNYTFKKDGPLNDIFQEIKFKVERVSTPLSINCSPNNLTFYVGEVKPISVGYSPTTSTPSFTWDKNNNNILLTPDPAITELGRRKANVEALKKGSTIVTVSSPSYGSVSCNLNINIIEPICPTVITLSGSNPTEEINFPKEMVHKYLVSNSTYLNVTTEGKISIKTNPLAEMDLTYTLVLKSEKNLKCDVKILPPPLEKTKIYCPNSGLSFDSNQSKVATVVEENQTLRPNAVNSWSLASTANATINASTGVITSKSTASNSEYYIANLKAGFVDGIDGDSTVRCQFSINSPLSQGCPVGQVISSASSWTLPSLPTVCPQQIEKQGQLFNNFIPNATINTRACGKDSVVYGSTCRSVYYNDTISAKVASVSMNEASNSYSVNYVRSYSFAGWTDEIVTNRCLTKTETYTVSEHRSATGTLKPRNSLECILVGLGNDLLSYIGLINQKPLTLSASPSTVVPGSNGAIITASYATLGGETIAKPDIDSSKGRIETITPNSVWKYVPPKNTDLTSVTIEFILKRPGLNGYGDERKGIAIDISYGKACDDFSIACAPGMILYGGGENGKSTCSFRYNNDHSLDNAMWSVSDSSFGRTPASGSTGTTLNLTSPSSGSKKSINITGIRQISCPRPGAQNSYSTPISVCSKYTYNCDSMIGYTLNGDQCEKKSFATPSCGSETFVSGINGTNGKCVAIVNDASPKTCSNYDITYAKGSCTKEGKEGDDLVKFCRYAYQKKVIGRSGTDNSNYVYSSSEEAWKACTSNPTSGYECSTTLVRTTVKTCSAWTSVCGGEGTYELDGECVKNSSNKPSCAKDYNISSTYNSCSATLSVPAIAVCE